MALTDDRFLDEFDASTGVFQRNNYFGQIDLLGKFETGSISHQILAGFDFNRFSNDGDRINADTPLPPLDIRNPNYDIPTPTFSTRATFSNFDLVRRSYDVYLQNQIAFSDNLKFLLGGRYDWISDDAEGDFFTGGDVVTVPTRNDGAFSPRIGLVYQPREEVSLYASYTRSFVPLSGIDNLSLDRNVTFDPTRGTQYEVGVKTDFLEGIRSAIN